MHRRQHRIASRQASFLILLWSGLQEGPLNNHKSPEQHILMKFLVLNRSTFYLGAYHSNLCFFFFKLQVPLNLSGRCVWHVEVFHLLPSANRCCSMGRIWGNLLVRINDSTKGGKCSMLLHSWLYQRTSWSYVTLPDFLICHLFNTIS